MNTPPHWSDADRTSDRDADQDPTISDQDENDSIYRLNENGVQLLLWLPNHETDHIQGRIARSGRPYEIGMLEDMAAWLKPGDHVLDIGANIGNHAVYLAAVADCRVTAFEPSDELCAILKRNVQLNQLERKVNIEQLGVGSKSGKARIESNQPHNLGAQHLVLTDADDAEVKIIALDDHLTTTDVRMVKIDVEGMELDVLAGAHQLLEHQRPLVYIEALAEEWFLSIDRELSSLGYVFWDTFNQDSTHLFVHNSDLKEYDRNVQFHKHLVRTQYYRQAAMEGVLPRLTELVDNLNNAWARFHQVSEELSRAKAQLDAVKLEAETAAGGAQKSLQAAKVQLKTKTVQLANEQTRQSKKESARAKEVIELASALVSVLDVASPTQRSRILSERIVAGLLAKRRRRAADKSIALAKDLGGNSISRLLLGAVAAALDPKPARQKWYAFRLLEFGLALEASKILSSVRRQMRLSSADKQKIRDLKRKARKVSQQSTALSKLRPPKKINVVLLCDEFTYLSFKDEFNAILVTPDNWRNVFKSNAVDLFFCEAAWSGTSSDGRPWKGKIYASENFSGENRQELLEILGFCEKHDIPTAFWNKEDPSHFEDRRHDFVKTALLFDHIFTTDEECVERYVNEYGHNSVHVLPFAVQPRLYNPIETVVRARKAVFAGAWYDYFPARCADMRSLFDMVIAAGIDLEIYNRHYGDDDANHFFPDEYRDYIRPRVEASMVPGVVKSGLFGINVNSVKHSPTMFARRVFELMATNTFVISNHSVGIEKMFPGLVLFADKEPEKLQQLSDANIDDARDEALHIVLEKHTYRHRFRSILNKVGITYKESRSALTIAYWVDCREQAAAATSAFEAVRAAFQNPQLLLLLSRQIESVELQNYYIDYNRRGVSVVSEEYAAKYAESDIHGMKTDFFVLLSTDDESDITVMKKAMLHRQYVDEEIIQFGSADKYSFGASNKRTNLLIPQARFMSAIKALSEGDMLSVYHV